MKLELCGRVLSLILASGAALLLASTALAAGSLVLHPSGFGTLSYSAWKAQQGLPDDDPGSNFQALYFQKMTATATFAAGVAVIKGLEGMPASELTGLQWTHRTDGHCGAGAPRWNVVLHNSTTNTNSTVFLGCYAAQHAAVSQTDPGNHSWCMDTFTLPATITKAPSTTTIAALAIVFDEGTDNAVPQPPGCPPGSSTPGFVYLDNISVTANGVTHVWTDASDNANGQTITQDPTGTDYVQSLLGLPLSELSVQ